MHHRIYAHDRSPVIPATVALKFPWASSEIFVGWQWLAREQAIGDGSRVPLAQGKRVIDQHIAATQALGHLARIVREYRSDRAGTRG